MKLILGGAWAGKLTWALQNNELTQADCWDLSRGLPDTPKKCLYHLESWTWERSETGAGADKEALLTCLGENGIVISREVGSGVVPMDARERLWREQHGSLVKALAAQAESVVRIFCGLPEVLK